ncbi:MAG: hypothetical protein B7C24_04835 [Bacteroidetes bacterium 4572_77]|nr:MAG: hypothetical protein B7C24_04835 [Bacteroidetes bacterium 4572_77]
MKNVFTLFILVPFLLFGQKVRHLEKDLLAYYPLNGNALDASSNKNDATIYSPSFTTGNTGENNHALRLNGIDDRIDIKSIDFSNKEEQSISIWIKTPNPYCNYNIIEFADAKNYPWTQYELFIKDQILCYHVRDKEKTDECLSVKLPIGKNQFEHIVVTKNNRGTMSIYFNGEHIVSKEFNPGFCKAKKSFRTTIGASFGHGYYGHFNGTFDDIKIYDRALSALEINNIYMESYKPKVVFHNHQIQDEDSFVLYESKDLFDAYCYAKAGHSLFTIKDNVLKHYKLNQIGKSISIAKILPLDFTVNSNKNQVMTINTDGNILAIMDDENNIHLIDVNQQKASQTISISKKLYNYKEENKDLLMGSPMKFISNNEILIAGNKYAGKININTQDIEYMRLKGFDWVATRGVTSTQHITKLSWQNGPISYSFSEPGMRENKYVLEDNYYLYTTNANYNLIKNKQNGEQFATLDDFVYDPNEKAYYTHNPIRLYNDEKQMTIANVFSLDCINNSTQLLAIKDNKSGFIIYDYLNIEQEMEKQYFIFAQEKDSKLSYEYFLKLYPDSRYKEYCGQKLADE